MDMEEILNDIIKHVKGLRVFIQKNGEINAEQQRFIDSNTKFIHESIKKYVAELQIEISQQFVLDKFEEQYDLCLKNINPFDILSGKVAILPNRGIFWFKEEGNNVRDNGLPIYENLYREDPYKPVMISFTAGGDKDPNIIYRYDDTLLIYSVRYAHFTNNPTSESYEDLFKKYKCIAE